MNFEIDKVRIVEENSNGQFATIECDLCRSGMNTHRLPISREAIKLSASSIMGKPILVSVNDSGTDFEGHEIDEVPCGFFLEEEPKVHEKDNELYITAKGKIWKRYFDDVMAVFERKNGVTETSMEIEMLEGEEATPFADGKIDLFSFTGLTLLGVAPAIKGSEARVLSFSEIKDEYDKEFTQMSDLQKFSEQRKKKMQEGAIKNVDKVEKLYDKFKLNDEGKDGKEMEITKFSQLEGREVYAQVIERIHKKMGKEYYVEEIYSDHVEVRDMRTKEMYDIPAKIKLGKDDEDISIDIDYDKMKKSSEQKQFADTKKCEDDDKEEKDKADENDDPDDKKDVEDGEGDDEKAEEFSKEKKMSLDANAYVGAMLAMLEAETAEQRKEAMTLGFTDEANIIMEKVFALMAERDELMAYKCEQMEAEKKMEVDKVLAEVKCDLDADKYSELQQEGYECKYEDVQAFASKAKAFAYENVKGSKKKETENIFMRSNVNQTKGKTNVFAEILND